MKFNFKKLKQHQEGNRIFLQWGMEFLKTERQATIEPWVFQSGSMTHRCGIVPRADKFPFPHSIPDFHGWDAALHLPSQLPEAWLCWLRLSWVRILQVELCIPDPTAKYIRFTVPLCWKWVSYPWCRCGHALISANKIPGIVNQSVRSLPCSYIKLCGELSESGSACFSSRRQTPEQIPNELIT